MLTKPRSRLTADPTIGVSDLMIPLDKYMVHAGERNLLPLVKLPPGIGWKSAPDLQWLARHALLWQEYLKVAPNSMVPPKKHRLAIEKLDQQQKCNYTKQSANDFSDAVDLQVRVGLKQLRELKQDALAKERAFRKVDQSVQDTINSLLSYITKVDKFAVAEEEDSQSQTPMREPLAIMDAPRNTDDTSTKTHSPKKEGLRLSPSKLFEKILAQKDSDEEIDIVYNKATEKLTTTTAQLENALINAGFGEGLLEARIPRKGDLARTPYVIAFVHYQTEEQVDNVVAGVDNTFLGDVSTQRVRCEKARPRDYTAPRPADADANAYRRTPRPPLTPRPPSTPPPHHLRAPPPPPDFPPSPGPGPSLPMPRPSSSPSVETTPEEMCLQHVNKAPPSLPSQPRFVPQPSMSPVFASRPPTVPPVPRAPQPRMPALLEENAALATSLAKQMEISSGPFFASMPAAPKTPSKSPTPLSREAPKTPPKNPPTGGGLLGQEPKVLPGPVFPQPGYADSRAPEVPSETASAAAAKQTMMVAEEPHVTKEPKVAPPPVSPKSPVQAMVPGQTEGEEATANLDDDIATELAWYRDHVKTEDDDVEEEEGEGVLETDPYQILSPAVSKGNSSSDPPTPKPSTPKPEPEETMPEETKPEETKPEEKKPEETTPEEKKPEETKAEEKKPEETKAEEKKPEETKAASSKSSKAAPPGASPKTSGRKKATVASSSVAPPEVQPSDEPTSPAADETTEKKPTKK
eukprot:s2333_g20.t1